MVASGWDESATAKLPAWPTIDDYEPIETDSPPTLSSRSDRVCVLVVAKLSLLGLVEMSLPPTEMQKGHISPSCKIVCAQHASIRTTRFAFDLLRMHVLLVWQKVPPLRVVAFHATYLFRCTQNLWCLSTFRAHQANAAQITFHAHSVIRRHVLQSTARNTQCRASATPQVRFQVEGTST